jgi:hypothetical protein
MVNKCYKVISIILKSSSDQDVRSESSVGFFEKIITVPNFLNTVN